MNNMAFLYEHNNIENYEQRIQYYTIESNKEWMKILDEINSYKIIDRLNQLYISSCQVEIGKKYGALLLLGLEKLSNLWFNRLLKNGYGPEKWLSTIIETGIEYGDLIIPNEILEIAEDFKKYDYKGLFHQLTKSNFGVFLTSHKHLIKLLQERTDIVDFQFNEITTSNTPTMNNSPWVRELIITLDNGLTVPFILEFNANYASSYRMYGYNGGGTWILQTEAKEKTAYYGTFNSMINVCKKHLDKNKKYLTYGI